MDGVTRGVVKKCYVLKCYIFYCVSGVDRGRGALDCISVQKEARERCKDVQAWGVSLRTEKGNHEVRGMEDLGKNVRCVHYGRRGVGDLCQGRRILSGGSSSVEVKTSQVLNAKERQVPVSTTTSRKGVLTEIRGKHRPELVDNEQSIITLILRFSKVRPISKFFHSMSSKRERLTV